jgi:hypothetical protein
MRTDRHDAANSCFSQFCEHAYKRHAVYSCNLQRPSTSTICMKYQIKVQAVKAITTCSPEIHDMDTIMNPGQVTVP